MKRSKAFILPVVLALATIASVMVVTCWWVTGLQLDIVSERELWYKNFYATQELMQDGLKVVQKQFDKLGQRLVTKKASVVWEIAPPRQQGDEGQAVASAVAKNQRLSATVCVSLPKQTSRSSEQLVVGVTGRQGERSVCTMRCLVTKVARSSIKGKEFRFVVSHCTVDATV